MPSASPWSQGGGGFADNYTVDRGERGHWPPVEVSSEGLRFDDGITSVRPSLPPMVYCWAEGRMSQCTGRPFSFRKPVSDNEGGG
jgi:hypothetical protein